MIEAEEDKEGVRSDSREEEKEMVVKKCIWGRKEKKMIHNSKRNRKR